MGRAAKRSEGPRKLRKSTPEERRKAVQAWHESGLSQAMFARQWGVNPITFSCWVTQAGARRAGERRGRKPSLAEAVKREVVATKRRFPAFGLRKIRDSLRRFWGFSVSTGSVRRVLSAEGIPPTPVVRRRRRKKPVGPPQEFERALPNELWQSDITYVDVPWSRKPLYLVAFLDDRSRYVVSFGLHAHQRGEIVLEALAEGISKYGRPQEVLTDQGRQYFAWRGKTDFQRRLQQEGIQHVVARAHHPQTVGKCERFWKTLQSELWSRVILRDLEEARERLRLFVAHYNFQRPHQGLEGLTPADRFFGVEKAVEEAMARAVEKNALRLAVGEAPRRPVYLVGQIDGQSVSVHGEGGKVVIQLPDGTVKEIEAKDLGTASPKAKEKSDAHDEERDEHDDDESDGEGAAPSTGGRGPEGRAPAAAGVQAPEVPSAQEDAAPREGALAGGERGGAGAGAPDGDGDPRDVAGEEEP
jgi:transposase InsO family protein